MLPEDHVMRRIGSTAFYFFSTVHPLQQVFLQQFSSKVPQVCKYLSSQLAHANSVQDGVNNQPIGSCARALVTGSTSHSYLRRCSWWRKEKDEPNTKGMPVEEFHRWVDQQEA